MKKFRGRTISLLLALAVSLSAAALAGDAEKPKDGGKTGVSAPQETAVFQIPKLMEGTLLRDLAKALADHPGIVLAQVDKQAGGFHVTFEPKKTNPEAIQKVLSTVAKDVRLEKVMPADGKASGQDCGKCPHAKSCPGAKETPKK